MANAKATELTPLVAASEDDIFYVVDDPGGTAVSKKITLANLRTSMYPSVGCITATGVAAIDTEALQTALSSANDAESDGKKTIFINGDFVVNDVLAVGLMVRLVGMPFATITYAGSTVTTYLVTVTGTLWPSDNPAYMHAFETGSCVQNIRLICDYKCRGLKYEKCFYSKGPIASNVQIEKARQLALDVIDCWGSVLEDVSINYCKGISVHTNSCNSTRINRLRLKYCYLFWLASGSAEIWEYAATHTIAETRTEYAGTILEDWPAEIDEADRACIVIDTAENILVFDGLLFEPVATGDFPTIACKGGGVVFSNVYFEAGYHNATGCLWRITGTGYTHGTHCQIENVFVTVHASTPVGYVCQLVGTTRETELRQVYAYVVQVLLGFVNEVGAAHTGTTVTHCLGYSDALAENALPTIVET